MNVLDYLEESERKYKNKVVFTDENHEVTYHQFLEFSQRIGSYLLRYQSRKKPIAVMMDKNVESLSCFFGVTYSGNFYVVIDSQMPQDRIEKIFETLNPIALITDINHQDIAQSLHKNICIYEDMIQEEIDILYLERMKMTTIDTDPLYALFTSGSTGIPKGVVISHRNVMTYTKWYIDAFGIDENTQFGSQTPFYFSMSVSDVFSTLFTGATLHILPKKLFSFPVKLIEYMNIKKVNTIYWVPSALCIIANLKVLDYVDLPYLKKVLFAGEVMPTKQLNYWIHKKPDLMYANLFGPTETTDICTYYIVNRTFENDEALPIGKACQNCDVFLLDENNYEVKDNQEGELCVRGSFVALGYYNNPKKTKEVFIQNPLQLSYPETIYRTGDIVKYNDRNELIYISRKDFQIKHMGYRIELGEIETSVSSIDKIQSSVVIYDEKEDKIILIYVGRIDDKEIMESISHKVPHYMLPQKLIKMRTMPYNQNGKIDRKWLKQNWRTIK